MGENQHIMDDLFPLTKEQRNSIEISREQIKNGRFSANEEVMARMRELINRKTV